MTAHHAQTSPHAETVAPGKPAICPDLPQTEVDDGHSAMPVGSSEATDAATGAAFPAAPEMVPMSQYQAVVDELARYKAYFGELPESALPVAEIPIDANHPVATANPEASESHAEHGLSPLASSPEESVSPEQSREETELLLNILSINDRDLAHEVNNLPELLNISTAPNTPLKHYGFQRSKSLP
ncbi:hypothetical protein EMOOHJMP_00015 [Microcystis phage MaAM05]|nr:hypothetical protein EMOOHJMP_00015 [Microcystis phage MaAM05]